MDNNPGGASIPPAPSAAISFDVYGQAWTLFQQQAVNWVLLILVQMAISFGASFVLALLPIIGQIVGMLLSVVLSAGVYGAAIKHVRGGKVEIGDLFTGFSNLGNVLAGGVLMTLATMVGMVFCIVPGIIVAGLLMFTYFLIMDRKVGGVDALKMSMDTLKPQLGMAAVFVLVTILIMAAGAIACGVGLLVTIPIGILSLALTYRNVMG
jgi:uncharacterized membrane protein